MKIDEETLIKAQFLYKIEFDKAIRANGGRVIWSGQHGMLWALNQAKVIDEFFWKGVCAGLAIEWLKEQADPINYSFTQQQDDARREVFSRPRAAYQRAEHFAQQVFDSHQMQRQEMKGLDGVLASAGPTRDFQYPFQDIAASFSQGSFFYVSTGTHAMGVVRVGGRYFGSARYDFYDPNVGVAKRVKVDIFPQYLKAAVDKSFEVLGTTNGRAEKIVSVQPFNKL